MNKVVDKTLEVVSTINTYCEKGIIKSFRTRSRQEITNIAFQGLQYTLAVIAARSSAKALEEAFRGVDMKAFITRVCTDKDYAEKLGLEKQEDIAYALYGFSILYILRDLGYVTQSNFMDFIRSEALNPALQVLAVEIATWLKRFSEAYIKLIE